MSIIRAMAVSIKNMMAATNTSAGNKLSSVCTEAKKKDLKTATKV